MGEKFNWGEHHISPDGSVELAGYNLYRELGEAQSYCTLIAKSHYENFVISNWFTPKEIKQHIENIYAFCRYGDDLGDDSPFPPNQRLLLLQEWQDDLQRAAENEWTGPAKHPIHIAIQHTAKEKNIPVEPFIKLIQAFKMDQSSNRCNDWAELKQYCVHSADPVGHMFLYVYGYDKQEMRDLADNTCTALQLANHWQDISRDLDQDRIYIPLDEMEQFGFTLEMYEQRVVNEQWRNLLSFQVERAQSLFDEGRKLWPHIDPRLAVDLEMFTKGGESILKSIRRQKFDTFKKRPRVSKFSQLQMILSTWWKWRRAEKKYKRSQQKLT
ncbi:MAG: squalene synthase HpnC [Euryarchaeota archaeon]|nr:squalene synthase HpnC [Euryarchaeota archaeon]MBT7937893.1 squalene synthase HpnC [Euryarchaeota archaeon]